MGTQFHLDEGDNMSKFEVYDKKTLEPVTVYDVAYNKAGYPLFLIYRENQWVRISAKHFSPQPYAMKRG